VNGAIFRQFDAQPTGTGYINSFVRLQAQGAKQTVEQGFNSDYRKVQFDENTSPQFTRSLKLADVPVVNIGGVNYREFLLDINQKASQPYLSLDELRFFVGVSGKLTGYSNGQLGGQSAVYDLGDNWVKLDARLNQGSGKGDMLTYVRDSAFAGGGDYVYLYSKFGVRYAGDAGFEEWAAGKGLLTSATGGISGTVWNQDGSGGVSGVVVFLDANHDGVLNDNEEYDVTGLGGTFSFDSLATSLGDFSTYHVTVVSTDVVDVIPPAVQLVSLQQNGQTQTGVDFIVHVAPPTPPGGGTPPDDGPPNQ